jgi:site-specific DNA-methyltransferase (adenine-specific)
MRTETIGKHTLYLGDCLEIMPTLEAGSIDVVLTDPPYFYLKSNEVFSWDEQTDFDEAGLVDCLFRVISKRGFLAIFGRGETYFKRNVALIEKGFIFKEGIAWDKCNTSSPLSAIKRRHEDIAIFGRTKKAKILFSTVPYVEIKEHYKEQISNDIKRVQSALNNPKGFNAMCILLETGVMETWKAQQKCSRHGATVKTDFRTSRTREQSALLCITNGLREQSIIKVTREMHPEHPTQKPVRLLERLLLITSGRADDIVLDCFMGSGSTGVACERLGRRFIGIEKDEKYFEIACRRLEAECNQQKLPLDFVKETTEQDAMY